MTQNSQDIGGNLSRVNTLGAATERMFSRLYNQFRHQQPSDQPVSISPFSAPVPDKWQDHERTIQRLHKILDKIGEGIVMQDLDGRIIEMNAAAIKLIGNRRDFWNSDLGKLFNAYRDITDTDSELMPLGEPTRVQVNNLIVGAQVAAVGNEDGQRIGTVIILKDVTRDALADRLKEQFVTAISHELRTPMAVIKGMADVIMGQPADKPPNRRFLETLSRNVDILDRMIVELLDISEMSADAFALRYAPLRIEALVDSVVNSMATEAKRNRLDIAVWIRDTERLGIEGDEQRLRWALGHLLQNSLRYTEQNGRIVVTVSSTDGEHITIQVIDSGVGISEKDLPHIFERFYRGEPRTSSGKLLDPRGLGQGLFVARTVIESHGGHLGVRSSPGQGSVFTIMLPVHHSN